MAYLMSDLAEGSKAALQLQQNMAAAPYVEQQASAAAEDTQLKLQQDRLKAAYAPQEAAAKAQQEEANLQKTKLANIVAQTGITVTTDKSNAVKKLMEDPTWSTKNSSDQATAIAAAWDVIDPESAAQMRVASATYDSKQLATDLKKHEANRLLIADAYATVKAGTPEQTADLISKFPDDMRKAIEFKIPGFFKQTDIKLQKAQLEALHLTGSNENTIATNQTRLLIADMQDSQRRSHDRTMELIAELRRNGGNPNQESKLELSQFNAAQRAWSRVNTDYRKPIKEAEDAWKKAIEEDRKKTGVLSVFTGGSSAIDEAITPEAKAELKSTKAWNELQKLKKERAQGKLDAIEGMPEGKEKNKLFEGLTKELESYDIEQPPSPKKETGAPSPEAVPATPPAKGGSSMLDTLPGGADSTSKNVTSTKGNTGTKESPLPPPSDPSKLIDGMYYDLPGKGPTLYTKPKPASTETKPAVSLVAPVKSTSGLPVPAVSNTSTDTAAVRTLAPVVKAGLKVGAETITDVGSAIADAGLQSIKDKIAKKQELTGVERAQAIRAGLLPASATKVAPTESQINKEIEEISAMPNSKGLSKKAIREIAIDLLTKRQDKL